MGQLLCHNNSSLVKNTISCMRSTHGVLHYVSKIYIRVRHSNRVPVRHGTTEKCTIYVRQIIQL